jgi:hypothetical protein
MSSRIVSGTPMAPDTGASRRSPRWGPRGTPPRGPRTSGQPTVGYVSSDGDRRCGWGRRRHPRRAAEPSRRARGGAGAAPRPRWARVRLFCASVASAFTGAVLYAFYEYGWGRPRIGSTRRVRASRRGPQAIEAIDGERDAAVGQVRASSTTSRSSQASGETLQGLLEKASPAVWFVRPGRGGASRRWAPRSSVFADGDQSFLITSYNTVRANTQEPVPGIEVGQGRRAARATLIRWEPAERPGAAVDPEAELEPLPWAPTDRRRRWATGSSSCPPRRGRRAR